MLLVAESAERIALRTELADIGRRRMDLEAEIKQLDNAVLRERLKADVARLTELEMQKRREVVQRDQITFSFHFVSLFQLIYSLLSLVIKNKILNNSSDIYS